MDLHSNYGAGMAGAKALLRSVGVSLIACLIGTVGTAQAEDGVMEADAVEVFERMSEHLKASKTMIFTSSSMREVVSPSGVKLLTTRSGIMMVQRPSHLQSIILRDDGSRFRVVFDGTQLTILQSGAQGHRYATLAAPEGVSTIDGMLDHLMDEHDYVLQLGDLLYEDLGATMGENLLSAIHLGPSLVNGAVCHHLSLEFSGVDAQVWVRDGDQPVPCRWAFNLTDEPGAPLFVSSFDSWQTNPTINPERFAVEPPAGATEVDFKEMLTDASSLQ